MAFAPTAPRSVVVLGRTAEFGDPEPLVDTAAQRHGEVLLLTMGYPVTASQRSFVARAVDRAIEAGVPLIAEIVTGTADLARMVGSTDRVEVSARGRERRRIESVLGRPLGD
jgi:hypothetical protein